MPKNYDLNEFISGFERRRGFKFSELSFFEVRQLAREYEAIDPMIKDILHAAHAKCQAA